MKKLLYTFFSLLLISFIVLFGCKKYKLPVVETIGLTGITQYSVKASGNITHDRGEEIQHKGICCSTSPDPTIADMNTDEGSGMESYSSSINYLYPNTTYFVRAYATSVAGTGYGSSFSFTTLEDNLIFNPNLSYGSLTDIDGNTYKTIIIGSQTWMAENLKTTHYRNGDPISNITDSLEWLHNPTDIYCYYKNVSGWNTIYGKLYNGYVVIDTRNIAPLGWHVPSTAEWTTLINYCGGFDNAGCKLKESGSVHWQNPDDYSTNESGFTAVGAGFRDSGAHFHGWLREGYWWTSTESFSWYIDIVRMGYDWCGIQFHENDKFSGYNIRCIKD
jgi:uncharacterized protein (TIGR02145 family)